MLTHCLTCLTHLTCVTLNPFTCLTCLKYLTCLTSEMEKISIKWGDNQIKKEKMFSLCLTCLTHLTCVTLNPFTCLTCLKYLTCLNNKRGKN